jgi:hypothetical protein
MEVQKDENTDDSSIVGLENLTQQVDTDYG